MGGKWHLKIFLLHLVHQAATKFTDQLPSHLHPWPAVFPTIGMAYGNQNTGWDSTSRSCSIAAFCCSKAAFCWLDLTKTSFTLCFACSFCPWTVCLLCLISHAMVLSFPISYNIMIISFNNFQHLLWLASSDQIRAHAFRAHLNAKKLLLQLPQSCNKESSTTGSRRQSITHPTFLQPPSATAYGTSESTEVLLKLSHCSLHFLVFPTKLRSGFLSSIMYPSTGALCTNLCHYLCPNKVQKS